MSEEIAGDQLRLGSEGEGVDAHEVWMPVVGYEGLYEASNLGRIRRALAAKARSLGVPGKAIKPGITHGYLIVSLSRDGVVQTHRVHRLVLTAFCGPAPFPGAHAAHNDGNRQNAALTNLRWASAVENQADRKRHGTSIRGERVHGAKLTAKDVTRIRHRIREGFANGQLAHAFGVSASTIHLIRHNKIWRHVA